MKNEMDLFRSGLWHPVREFSELQKGINRLFEDPGWVSSSKKGASEVAFAPACDIEETEAQYLMSFDLPGMSKDEIKVELNDRELVVSGERKEERKEDRKSRHVVERYFGSFRRTIALPATVDADQIQATFENGVLRLSVPKAETAKTRQIKIGEVKSSAGSSVRVA